MHAGDLDVTALLLGDPAVMTYYPRPGTREGAADWIAWNEDNYARDGFGLWIAAGAPGRRTGHRRATACRDFARSRGIERLIAITHPGNAASQRVAEKVGLSFEKATVTTAGVPIHVHSAGL